MKILLIAFFGVLGVMFRYSIESLCPKNQVFPYSTLLINLLGCFIAGVIYSNMNNKGLEQLAPTVLIGFCGGLTTFSGYALQGVNLVNKGELFQAVSYMCISPILGMLFVFLGVKLSFN